MRNKLAILTFLFYLNTSLASSAFYFGGGASGAVPVSNFLVRSEPAELNGYKLALQLYHPKLSYQIFTLFFDASYNYLKQNANNISIVALAPVLEMQLYKSQFFNPFMQLSAGPGYMNRTMFGNRNLGMHYTFQDMFGLGLKFGKKENIALSWRIIHFSNANLAKHNAGLTEPLVLSLHYTFKD